MIDIINMWAPGEEILLQTHIQWLTKSGFLDFHECGEDIVYYHEKNDHDVLCDLQSWICELASLDVTTDLQRAACLARKISDWASVLSGC